MNTVIAVTKPPVINFKYILLFAAVLLALFLLSQLFTVKQVAENTPDLTTEDLAELAEEIYSAGEISQSVKNLPIEASALAKMISEIERILSKTTDYPGCELYFLKVKIVGDYPILGYGNEIIGFEYMNAGDVWKVGQTCNGEDGRYPSDYYYTIKKLNLELTNTHLQYIKVAEGYYREILIMEKLMIYTYSLWSGHISLPRPPGCKINR